MESNLEIEKKYLVDDFPKQLAYEVYYIQQLYLMSGQGKSLRIRCDTVLDHTKFLSEQQEHLKWIAQCTIEKRYTMCYKSHVSGITRKEFEFALLKEVYEDMAKTAVGFQVNKLRYRLPYDADPKLFWDIDVFLGLNKGLQVAELEVPSEDIPIHLPNWIKTDISTVGKYSNVSLSKMPFTEWRE